MSRAEQIALIAMSKNEPEELAGERDFIPGIYNYCDRWCEKCAFTSRCRVYATEAADADLADAEVHDINNSKFWRKLESIFRETHDQIAKWAAEAGVDLDAIDAEAAIAEHELKERAANEQQVSVLARQYAKTVEEWFDEEFASQLKVYTDAGAGPGPLEEIDLNGAAEVIRWYQFFVAAKVIRSLMGREDDDELPAEEAGDDDQFAGALDDEDDSDAPFDFVQDDGNGSAKIALIAIDRSMAAWQAMEMSLPDKSDSIAPILAELERLRWLMEQEFPDARGFMRPGFDEVETDLVS